MRIDLLPVKNAYKANLHCHTTVSDGMFTPLQIKELYKARGYQIVGYTDHEVLVPHDELNDDDFIALSGYESQTFGDLHLPKKLRRVCHMNVYPKERGQSKMPFFNMSDVLRLDRMPDLSSAVYDGEGNDEKQYSAHGINALIKEANEKGFIVSLNHPTWSKEDASVYTNLKGLFAVEIYNYKNEIDGYDSYCPYVYEEMLRSGQRIGCIAGDDTHNEKDMFGGFTYVLADELSHEAIIRALENGDFYASRGPEIKELWYEGGYFHIACSPAKRIALSNSGRRTPKISVVSSDKCDITYAKFPLSEEDILVRFTVTDECGNTANTRGYWRDEFEKAPACADIGKRKVGAPEEKI